MNCIALILLLSAQVPQATSTPLRPSGIAARINGEVITWDEVELELHSVPAANRPEMRKPTLRRLAEEMLFLQEAKAYNIDVPETQIDTVIEAERKASGMTIERYQQQVNSQYGISITEYRAILKRQRMISILMSRLATEPLRSPNSKLRLLLEFVSPEEMREYYLKNKAQFEELRQIDVVFIAFQFQTPAEREEKTRLAASIRRRVLEDSPLYAQALAHMDPALMPIVKSALPGKPPEFKRQPAYENLSFQEAPFSDEIKKLLYETLKEGDLSEPVVEGNLVSLYHLRRKINEKERTFEDAQPFIRRQLESAKRRINQKLLRDDLVRRSFVEPPDLFN
ncbi:MAG TPA: peptidylprolyl isomerase [Planctomycetota bacterium]|nr:peptidylprolyl isomerase [Planctomycetota bacterium]